MGRVKKGWLKKKVHGRTDNTQHHLELCWGQGKCWYSWMRDRPQVKVCSPEGDDTLFKRSDVAFDSSNKDLRRKKQVQERISVGKEDTSVYR